MVEKARKDNGIPRTAQQSIPFDRMFQDGICRVKDGYYTKTIQFQDINYQLAQQEDRAAIFEEWCSFLNFFDSSVRFELSFVNMCTASDAFEKTVRIPFQQDGFDSVRSEYSSMLKKQLAQGNNGLTKTNANSHFLRTAGPHFPDSPGHIKRTAWDISRAEGTPPC